MGVMEGECVMFKSFRLKPFLLLLFGPLALGMVSALLAGDIPAVYQSLTLPDFAPPAWVFGPVWAVLYLAMGLASWYVYESPGTVEGRDQALTFYAAQLLLNVLWPPLFFRAGWYTAAFWELCATLVLALVATGCFYLRSKKAFWLMIPYCLWLIYAATLNRAISVLQCVNS